MLNKTLAAVALMVLALGGFLSTARADDVFRLDIRDSARLSAAADTLDVRGFYRPYFGYAYRPYFYPRFYGPGVSFYYNRPFLGYGYYSYYRPYAYNYYYAPPVYYSPYYYCPISYGAPSMPYAPAAQFDVTVLRPYANGTTAPALSPVSPQPYVTMPAIEGSYPYDGGPVSPVPLPGARPTTPSSSPPPATVPLEGRAVSLPSTSPKFTYPAYGEKATPVVDSPPVQHVAR